MSQPTTIPAFGTSLKLGGTAIALVTEIDGPEPENASRPTVHLLSTWKTKRATIPEGGELSFKAFMNATNYAAMTAALGAGTEATYSLAFPNDDAGSAVTVAPSFKAYPSKCKLAGMQEDGTVTLEVTLTLTDSVTF
jgi:hypothetical protein